MDITTFLAALWGPTLLAVGIGMFASRRYYVQLYRDLQKHMLSVLLFGIVAIPAGIAHVLFHNSWNTLPEIIVSVLGWGTLVKGVIMVVLPTLADASGDRWANLKLIPFSGVLTLVIGAYLTWFAYF